MQFNQKNKNKVRFIQSLNGSALKAGILILTASILSSCLSHDERLSEIYNVSPTPPMTAKPTPDTPSSPDGKPEMVTTGLQAVSLGSFGQTGFIRDFVIPDNAQTLTLRTDNASSLLPTLDVTASNAATVGNSEDFVSLNTKTALPVPAAGGTLPVSYASTYKDVDALMRIGHIHGQIDASSAGYGIVPIDSVTVVGRATQGGNVPTDGKAQYTGDSTYRAKGLDQTIEYGTSQFDVDFAAKSLTGTLSAGAGFHITDGVITSNQFTATNTQASFYGGNAELLGGIYETKNAQGTYGASKGQATAPMNPTPPADAGAKPIAGAKPEATKSGLQMVNMGSFGRTDIVRDFTVANDAQIAPLRTDLASNLLPSLKATVSNADVISNDAEFTAMSVETDFSVPAAGGALPLTYLSVYKDFGEMMRIGHTNGQINASSVGYGVVPVDSVVVVGNAAQAANMPRDGQAQYTGDSTYRALGVDGVIQYGSATFDVDFVNHSLTGTLTAGPGFSITDGVITGNQFIGTNTEGGFYGEHAEWLGGIYETETGQGTYGARKQ